MDKRVCAPRLPRQSFLRTPCGASIKWRLKHCGPIFLPAAGYRNGTSSNNVGSNGNYWSSQVNSSNVNNAWNMNFNSGNRNPDNNNNRYNGFSVRPVSRAFASVGNDDYYDKMEKRGEKRLTYSELLADLHVAFDDARRHKGKKPYVVAFSRHLDENLRRLADDLWTRQYVAQPSTCFMVTDPKCREVFAAQFRDRIVHHLYFNYVHEMLERTFIADSYSCIRGRGTHYGIQRLEKHIRQESREWTQRCFVLKLDIRGYFTHIDRKVLLDITERRLREMFSHRLGMGDVRRWREVVDMDFVLYLTREIVLLDPTLFCRMRGSWDDWSVLPHDKSLFYSGEGRGLPIGNLTSQLFSNVYLSGYDDYMKRVLHCRHYGRYVDDSYVVSRDREFLLWVKDRAAEYLGTNLHLSLHEGKTGIVEAHRGVLFLGAYLKPHRQYVSNETLLRMKRKLCVLGKRLERGEVSPRKAEDSINSFLGVLGHYSCWHIRRALFADSVFARYGYFDKEYRKYICLKSQWLYEVGRYFDSCGRQGT